VYVTLSWFNMGASGGLMLPSTLIYIAVVALTERVSNVGHNIVSARNISNMINVFFVFLPFQMSSPSEWKI